MFVLLIKENKKQINTERSMEEVKDIRHGRSVKMFLLLAVVDLSISLYFEGQVQCNIIH